MVKFDTPTHCTERILDYNYTDTWGPTKMAFIGGNTTLCHLQMITLGDVGYIP